MTLTALGYETGFSQGHQSRIETGQQAIRSDVLLRIAGALGAKPFEFFLDEKAETQLPRPRERLTKALGSPEFVTVAERMASAFLHDGRRFASIRAVIGALLGA